MLGEWVRSALARSICRQYVDDSSGALQTLTIDPALEQELLEAVTPGMPNLALEPSVSRQLIQNLSQQMERMIAMGYQQPVLLCMSALRLPLRLNLGELHVAFRTVELPAVTVGGRGEAYAFGPEAAARLQPRRGDDRLARGDLR